MTTDQFLDFWSAHNITIIEGLIALILVMAAYISYRLIFSAPPEVTAGVANPHLDSAQIEKTLQRILDAQGTKTGEATAGASAVAGPEVEELRQHVKTSEAQIAELKSQLAAAAAQPGAGATAADGAGGGGAGTSSEERSALENKIHDLEARLAEYEIISEDIADLSRYKEENVALNQRLASLGGGTPNTIVSEAPSAPAPAAAAPAAAPATPAANIKVEAAAPAPAPTTTVAPSAPAEATPAAAPAAAAAPPSDENLMKEFAAAIEGQKPEALPPETDKLMSEFENFVKKG